MPTVTTLVYSETTRSLTCTSTGGPATTVTWGKNGAVITINATYQQTQVVTDTMTGEYETVLTIAESVTDIFGTYSCTVVNARGASGILISTMGEDLFIMCFSIIHRTGYWDEPERALHGCDLRMSICCL